ncbi:MAG: hypothetical protein KF795_00655 [Labilithrix sp.]|nr:hypothetical protein [Labilithrix sp.]
MNRRSTLTPEIVEDGDALAFVTGAMLMRTKGYRRLSAKVRQAQRKLRRGVDDEGWRLYLHVEDLVNDRASFEIDTLVAWAFKEGRRWEPCRRGARRQTTE